MNVKGDSFREFVFEKWFQHKYEILAWEKKAVDYDVDFYFKKNKDFLKKEYKNFKLMEGKN